ncbi:MAG TPA: hypothetical protein VFN13_08825 [Rudaea sp.]|nr:hypothetical protein [Rudaea sp.]
MKKSLPLIIGMSTALLSFTALAQTGDQVTHFTTSDGTQVTLTSGQPPESSPGPVPPFAQLDTNKDGWISRTEARAYAPLINDFDYIAHHANRISRHQFEHWNSGDDR